MQWHATVARYAEYQKQTVTITAPYHILPAYVYRVVDSAQVADSGGRYQETQSEYAEQVRAGTAMHCHARRLMRSRHSRSAARPRATVIWQYAWWAPIPVRTITDCAATICV